MVSTLLLGALAATASLQERDEPKDRLDIDIRIPSIEIEIPEMDLDFDIDIPGLDLYFQGFEFFMPKFDFAFDFDMGYIDFEIPEIEIQIPKIDLDLPDHVWHWSDHWGWDHHWDWDWDDHRHRHNWDWRSVDLDFDTDTTFDVTPTARLEVRNHAGEIFIRTWDRSAVRVEASHGSRDKVKVHNSRSAVEIKSESRYGPADVVDYEITIPRTMSVDLWGIYTDISVDGARSGVRVETLEGDIVLRNCEGEIRLSSVEGEVVLQRSKGRVEVNSVEESIEITDFEGEIFAESIDGDIRLEDVASNSVEAKTVDGDIFYTGTIVDDGRYRLTTHDGDVIVAIAENINATVSVATFDGEFEASFPIELSRAEAGRRFSFTIGDGSARLELHSFDGDIQLVRQ